MGTHAHEHPNIIIILCGISTCISGWSGELAPLPQTFGPLTASCTASCPGSPLRITALLLPNRPLTSHPTTCGTHGALWSAAGNRSLRLTLPLLPQMGGGEGEKCVRLPGRVLIVSIFGQPLFGDGVPKVDEEGHGEGSEGL